MKDILGTDRVCALASVYDRHPNKVESYYTIYTDDDLFSSLLLNPIVMALHPSQERPVRGGTLVIVDSPLDSYARLEKRVETDEFARMVWWYIKAGIEPKKVY